MKKQQHSRTHSKLSNNKYISRFLLVSLNVDVILQETTAHSRRQKLNAITDGSGLESAYGETLSRIKRQGGGRARLGMAALMWISHAERPLKTDELCQALAVEIGSLNLHPDGVPSIGTLLTCCQGLITVDKEASTVRLIHITLQEYLRGHPDNFGKVHSTIAETCLSYLNSQQIRALSPGSSPDLQGQPFLKYSSLYWGAHARRDLSDYARRLALMLFDDYNHHISTKVLLESQQDTSYDIDFNKPFLFSGLHCASFFGIAEIVAGLIEVEGCDINQRDCVDDTPLMWAAVNGHERVVEMLLGQGDIRPDKPGEDGQTPLWVAAWKGHEGVVKMLLGRDEVNPQKPDKKGRTPLWCAAIAGNERVVKILLQRDEVNPDQSGNDGTTPLFSAAENGQEVVVKILLQRDEVNPDKPDNVGRTPLLKAALNGHEGVVKILLQRDEVNPDQSGNDGRTPLWYAAHNGNEGVVKILLQRDEVNPDKPDNDGLTPLSCAAGNGHEGVVKILLQREEVKPDQSDNEGQTPLWCAAANGREGVVKMLLERDEVNPDKPDNDGQTPLWCAAEGGYEGVVKILLQRDEVNPDRPDNDGQTPLWCAAENGHEGVVKILLERDVVRPQQPTKRRPSTTLGSHLHKAPRTGENATRTG